jgi:predicted secreted protein
MEFKDNRSKRIVFIGNCMLNQNARFPGIAVKEGSFEKLVEIITKNGIGIEQLPCLECLGWGGVSRKTYYKFQPLVLDFIDRKIFPLIRIFYSIWLYRFSCLCRKEASKVVNKIRDYLNSGYEVLGIVVSNDSPTCGVNLTMDLLEAAKKFKSLGFKAEYLENPDVKIMRTIIPSLCTKGSGLFIGPVISKLRKRDIDVQVIGFDPWASSLKEEAERVAMLLNV